MTPLPLVKDIVLVGGGHSHALVLKNWAMDAVPGARLTVINPEPTAPYTGMLPGDNVRQQSREELEIDLVRLAQGADARVIFGFVEAIDRARKTLKISGRPDVRYDLVSIDIGVTSDMPEIPGFLEHGVAAKPLGAFADRWQSFLDAGAGSAVVIGGGVAGVELALAMAHVIGDRGQVSLVEEKDVLRESPSRSFMLNAMAASAIQVFERTQVTRLEAETVHLDNGEKLEAGICVGAAGARPFPWLEDTGLMLNDGYIEVDENLMSSDPSIFAAGDCAYLTMSPRPKAGVFAVRAAPILGQNLKAALRGKRLKPFKPQRHYLKLISLGRKAAVAEKWGYRTSGRLMWQWKDRIDQAFMQKLNTPHVMKSTPVPDGAVLGVFEALGGKPLCGGCGAKVGPNVLSEVLKNGEVTRRNDVELGVGDDAAVLKIGDGRQVISTDHLRSFWDDPWVMAKITAVHALGDIWAMGAEPQAVLAHVTLPRMAENMQSDWLSEIMDGAQSIFENEGAVIVGGHTSLGPELQIGFTVSGLAPNRAITLAGALEGDALILTRPIGSGTILAGVMDGRAAGDDVAKSLAIMGKPQGDAAKVLSTKAHAMTDVTGFGLAGHLQEMTQASQVSAVIELNSVPFLDGVVKLAEMGIRSSIWDANRRAVDLKVPETPEALLLFDPQTAGGLLAAVPANCVDDLLTRLKAVGHEAAHIGRIVAKGARPLSLQ